jgi:hypothetical protein
MFVLITVPHGTCITKIQRTCDLRAIQCSNILKNVLNKRKIKHNTVKFNLSRLEVDANRIKPDKYIYYTKINNRKFNNRKFNNTKINNTKINNTTPANINNTIYYDVNKNYIDYDMAVKYWNSFNKRIVNIIKKEKRILLLDIHSFPKGSFDGAQIAIIDIQNINRPELYEFANMIISTMGINIKIYNGADNNIQNTYAKFTYPLLIEFCEDRTYLLNDSIYLFFEKVIEYFK